MNKSIRKSVLISIVVALAIIVVIKYYQRYITNLVEVELLSDTGISDGPYFMLDNEQVNVKWISNGSLISQNIELSDYINIGSKLNYEFKVEQLLALTQKQSANFSDVENMVVLSDIHGQYDLFIDLLKANNIIDVHGDWNYNKGHLVIIGDAFDRGDKVTETLWHILKLSDQASQEGGKVHYLLGNHDIMVLNADLRYINEKYNVVEDKTGLSYDQLFGKQSLMGQWLRACPVVLRINDIVFNHAGLSMTMVDKHLSIEAINHTFATNIIDNNRDSIRASEQLSLLARSNGPIWYRGYFKDTTLTNESIDSILHHFKAKHIVVGHTSMERVEVLFDNRILAADTSIKKGESGELLFIEDGKFYRAGLDGEKKLLW
ncbi:metallophosphoesterase [Carboxylicivirga marina]|uniref:Metallophosphoesterase n=1 Tax=Carboxylicivirga marina TaxID=2800988 RepID=A0ABS1HMQ8_9BACT|nr:metallophosphoesterase [Carboxylicivirga marina]MBK3518954.1 metallophosphoesterase [Carboxylicivirga marina]